MSEGREYPTTTHSPESGELNIIVSLETSTHFTSDKERQKIIDDLSGGDLTAAHIWNPKVAKRLRESRIKTLVIDGLPPTYDNKDWIWNAIPGNPKDISPDSKEIYVVAGDTLNYRDALNPLIKNSDSIDPEKQKQALDFLDQYRTETDSIGQSSTEPNRYVMGIAVASLVASTIDSIWMSKKMSRRNVLKHFAAFGIGAAANMAALKVAPKETVPMKLNDTMFDTIMRYLKNEEISNTALKGRTALLIQKGIDAAEVLHEPNVAVIAGEAHKYIKGNLLTNQKERDKAIIEYTKLLLSITNEVSKKAGLNEEDSQKERENLLNYLIKMRIFTVSEAPDKVARGDIDSVINKAVQIKEGFEDYESPGVRNALRDFFPKSKEEPIPQDEIRLF